MRIRKNTETMDEYEMDFIASVSDALAHPVRLAIFRYIMQCNKSMEKVCNKDLCANFDYAQATISQHVGKLVKSGLLEVKQENRFSYYFANMGILMKYIDATKKFSVL